MDLSDRKYRHEVDKMSKKLKVPLDKKLLETVSRETNTRGYSTVCTWEDLKRILDPSLYKKIIKLAHRYGYDVSEAP